MKSGHDHVRVRVAQVAGDFAEVFAVPALLEEVQHGHSGVVAADKGVRVVAHALQRIDLGGQHAEDDLVLVAGGIGDLHIGAIQVPRVMAPFCISFILPVPEASVPAREICSLTSLGGHQPLAHGNIVFLQVDDLQPAAYIGIGIDHGTQLDKADDLFGQVIAGGRLGAKEIGAGLELGVGVLLDIQVVLEDLQGIEVLALILMQTLDLHIEQRIGIDGDAALGLQVAGKIRLVLPLQLAGSSPQACLIVQVCAQPVSRSILQISSPMRSRI